MHCATYIINCAVVYPTRTSRKLCSLSSTFGASSPSQYKAGKTYEQRPNHYIFCCSSQNLNNVENVESIPLPLDPSQINDEDRQRVDEITSNSEATLREVEDSVRKDIADLRSTTETLADEMIQEETEALLSKYDTQQEQLLDTVKEEQRIIQDEFKKIDSLSSSKESKPDTKPMASQLLLACTFLFGLASIIYTWNAIANSDQQAITNAVLDAAVAVCSSYFASKYDSKQ